ncbi:hypothetical protein AB0D54_22330 [Streptomyces xanthophaeus]|uniref:hypothetical protein n=1 Tax=Streptomyces xanthophaeus TaxID=67385 RepID=UPI00343D635E
MGRTDTLIALVAAALAALLVGTPVRAAVARRSARRAGAAQAGESVAVPCRVTWKEGLGRRSSVYGKLSRPMDGAEGGAAAGVGSAVVFKRPGRRPVELPAGGRASRRPAGWRPAMQVFAYRGPGGEEIQLLVHDAEAELVTRLLGIPDPADCA